jgi:hypothetical protein
MSQYANGKSSTNNYGIDRAKFVVRANYYLWTGRLWSDKEQSNETQKSTKTTIEN